jgi:hypothetical protein
MTSSETKGRVIYTVVLWNDVGATEENKKKLSHGDEQCSSDVISGSPKYKAGILTVRSRNSVSFMNCSSGWEANTNNTLMKTTLALWFSRH